MNRLDVNLINLFSNYHVWEESNRFYFETDYKLKYFVLLKSFSMRIQIFSFICVVQKEGNRLNVQDFSLTGLIKLVNKNAITLKQLRLKERNLEQKSTSQLSFRVIIRKQKRLPTIIPTKHLI